MRLSTQQLGRMSQVLEEVVDADQAGREQWLLALAPEHRDLEPALRRALLPDDGGAAGEGLLDALPKLGVGGDAPAAGVLQEGDLVGPYRLMRPLGAGGMAEVWLAQRADGAFKREVALKTPSGLQWRQTWRPLRGRA
jgi:serine/threonine-protein kinase